MLSTTMLTVWVFAGETTAQRAVYPLALSRGRHISDAAVVSWPPDRLRPLAWQESELSSDGALSGAFWGLLVASLFLLPLTVPAEPAAPGAIRPAPWSEDGLSRLGLDASFAADIRDAVVEGTSALFLFSPTGEAPALREGMPADAQEIACLTLTPDQENRLHAVFDD